MWRTTLVLALLLPAVATAQTMPSQHHAGMMPALMDAPIAAMPTQPGHGAFGAIQEIIEVLEADPMTEWSKVNIEALRQHLIDMDNVTLHADVKSEAVDGGMVFVVSGPGAIEESIQRMVTAHAATMNGVGGWELIATTTEAGATLTVHTPAAEVEKLQGLGFIGVLTHGMHHQMHHLMIARGGASHSE